MDALDLLCTSPLSTSSIPEKGSRFALGAFHLVGISSSGCQQVEVLVVLVVEDNPDDIVVVLVEDVHVAGESEVSNHPSPDGH